jgi:plasmid stabilization system protein ParE
MDYQVILSDFFINDLKEIVDYLNQRANDKIASRIGNELIDRALGLGRNPFIGQIVKGRLGARKILRYSCRIYYDVNEQERVVEILRVWHGARDPKTLRLT